ncbi:unnamed protein product [Boreogadus saida]
MSSVQWLCFRRSLSLMWDRWECNRLRLVPVWGTDLSGVRGSSHQSLRLLCIYRSSPETVRVQNRCQPDTLDIGAEPYRD